MCDLGRPSVCVALLIGALSWPLASQQPTPSRAQLARLERLWRDAASASARVDSAAAAQVRTQLDTARVEDLIVLSPPEVLPLAQIGATEAWPAIRATFGDATRLLRRHPLGLFSTDRESTPPHGFPSDAVPIPIFTGISQEQLRSQLMAGAQQALRTLYDGALADWLSASIRTTSTDSAYAGAYADLVTSPSFTARHCLLGDLAACGVALALAPPGDRAVEWYDAAGRRAIVASGLWRQQDAADGRVLAQCLDENVDDACIRVLRHRRPEEIPPPLPPDARERIVRTALALGGASAFNRLLASAGRPMTTRLAVTAGLRLDSVVAQWRERTIAERPASVDLSPSTGWVALGWGLVLTALTLGNTRWRS